VVTEALRIDGDDPLALAQEAELGLRAGDARGAAAGFRRAFAASGAPRYLIDLARVEALGGDAAAADRTRAHAERLLRADLAGHGVGHRLELVELLVDRGTPAGIAEAIALAREEHGLRATAATRFQLARAMVRTAVPAAQFRSKSGM
jgi:hypothetical protein